MSSRVDEEWIYPFASTIDAPNPLPPIPEKADLMVVKRDSCPNYIPVPLGAKVYKGFGPMVGIEAWHKRTGAWVD